MTFATIRALGRLASSPYRIAREAAENAGFETRSDLFGLGVGLSTAAASLAFAAYMLTHDNSSSRVNGIQYLAIFAQPNLGGRPAAAVADINLSEDVDRMPTGSIPLDDKAVAQEIVDPGFSVISGQPGIAWAQKDSVIRAVRIGDVVEGAGRVKAIVLRDGMWQVLGESGAPILRSGESASAGVSPVRLSRSSIFNGGQ
jgi:hypothetical protein